MVSVGFFSTAGNALLGHPSNDAEHLAVVGPTTSAGSTALASNISGMPPGIGVGQTLSERFYTNTTDKLLDHSGDRSVSSESTSGAMSAANEGFNRAGRSADDQVLAQVSWVERLANSIVGRSGTRRVVPTLEDGINLDKDGASTEVIETIAEEGVVQTADFSGPVGTGIVVYLAIRYRRVITKWLKKCVQRRNIGFPNRPMGRRIGLRPIAKFSPRV